MIDNNIVSLIPYRYRDNFFVSIPTQNYIITIVIIILAPTGYYLPIISR